MKERGHRRKLVKYSIGLLVISGLAYFLSSQAKELKRVEVLLSRTREDYATRNDLRDDMSRLVEALHRVEDKLDRALSKE